MQARIWRDQGMIEDASYLTWVSMNGVFKC